MKIRDAAQRIRQFFSDELWSETPASRWALARGLGLVQFAVMTAEGFVRDRLLLRASALSYFTVLSLIPIIAVAVAIASGLGIDVEFAERIVESIAAGAPAAAEMILEQVREAKFSALGGMGAAVLLVTTIFGIGNIERSFNTIWGVHKARGWGRRFPDYLAVLLVVPLLATGLSLATGLKSQWLVQQLLEYPMFRFAYDFGLGQLPWFVLSSSFALMFWFLPNTSVRFSSAALGGAVSGLLVLLAQDAYVRYSVGVARADALFGAFAQLPLLFVWIYIFWAIVLFGAEIAFAHQHLASYRREIRGADVGPAARESIALRVAIEVARTFRDAAPAPTAEALSDRLELSVRTLRDVLAQLERAGIVAERVDEDGDAYSLGRPAERIFVFDILQSLRGEPGETTERGPDDRIAAVVAQLQEGLDCALRLGGGEQSLAELLTASEPAGDASPSNPSQERRLGVA